MLIGWLNRQQKAVIDYQREEILVLFLLEQAGGKPGPFTDSQRRRLAKKASALGRQELEKLAQLARPDTLFVIELKSRLVPICGSMPNPDGELMLPIARSLTDYESGFATGKSHLIIDRDTKYTIKFKTTLNDYGIEIVLCPPRAPRCNAYVESFGRSIKFE